MQLVVLGSNPDLSLGELTSLYGERSVRQFSRELAIMDVKAIDLERLGGSLKVAQLITDIPSGNLHNIEQELLNNLERYFPTREGKLNFGISVYGHLPLPKVRQLGITLKKALKARGQSVRYIPNKAATLNAAQVHHNHLVHKGVELIIGVNKNSTITGVTRAVQNIDSYAARDFERPQRDAKVGMLPPKLAQIMLNLANPPADSMILDPFCGTGVVLQEAILMKYDIAGSDLDPRMVDYTQTNLDWLVKKYAIAQNFTNAVRVADARTARFPGSIGAVVSEAYLGPPLSQAPPHSRLEKIRNEVNSLLASFLKNLAGQINPSTPVCLAVPCWQTGREIVFLPLIDQISTLGYNFSRFGGLNPASLIYRRPDAVVGRQLLVLKRK